MSSSSASSPYPQWCSSAGSGQGEDITLAVVILTWNRLELIKRYLPSIVEHWGQPGVAIVVADNGSDDGTVEWVAAAHPKVLLLQLGKNYGFAAGYQLALAAVRSFLKAPYYLLLNNDVRVDSNFIPRVLTLFESDATLGALAPKLLSDREPDCFEYAGAAGGFLDRFGYPFCRGRILSNLEHDQGQYDSTIDTHWASGACLFVRASVYWEAGGLDGRFFAHMEEIDLCWRIRRLGYRVLCLGQEKVFHLGGGTLDAQSPRKLYFNHRNNLFMLRKNLPGKRVTLLLARYLLDIFSGMVYLLSGHPSQFKALAEAHRDYWRHRKDFNYLPFPNERSVGLADFSILWQCYMHGRREFHKLPCIDRRKI